MKKYVLLVIFLFTNLALADQKKDIQLDELLDKDFDRLAKFYDKKALISRTFKNNDVAYLQIFSSSEIDVDTAKKFIWSKFVKDLIENKQLSLNYKIESGNLNSLSIEFKWIDLQN